MALLVLLEDFLSQTVVTKRNNINTRLKKQSSYISKYSLPKEKIQIMLMLPWKGYWFLFCYS